jgi:two-component system sensor histidine kinase ResE
VFIFRTVVGKLWLTIIGLVAVVLLILGLFLNQYISTYFSQTQDRKESLTRLALKLSEEAAQHLENEQFYRMTNELLGFQYARMVVVTADFKEKNVSPEQNDGLSGLRVSDFFSKEQLNQVFAGTALTSKIPTHSNGVLESKPAYLAVAVPLKSTADNKVIGATVVFQSLQSLEDTQFSVMKLFAYTSLIGFLMTTFFAFFLFSRITRPLNQLKKAADLIAHGEYGTRVPIVSSDEIGELAKTFNQMGEELHETIQALHHEKEHLSSVLRSMTDAVITVDAEGNVILTNPQGEKIIQEWSAIHWSTLPDEERQQLQTPRRLRLPEPLQPLFEAVVAESKETVSKLHVQNGVWSVVMTPLYSWEAVRGAVAVLRDVTEEHRLDKLRKDFVANVSHELRTPLSMLQGYSEALLDDIAGTPEERKELAQVIHDESLRMGRLVRDLLDLARMEAGHLEMNFRAVEMNALIKRIYRKFSVLAKEQGIQLAYDLPEHELWLQKADEDRLEQVLTNLLDNAFRHTPGGASIRMKAEPVKLGAGENGLLLEVSDEGQGIPPEDVPYIFERFYKADKARTRGSTGGTGLGLAIVKNIVEAHGGTVTVKSVLGHGTTFSILLPSGTNDKRTAHSAR